MATTLPAPDPYKAPEQIELTRERLEDLLRPEPTHQLTLAERQKMAAEILGVRGAIGQLVQSFNAYVNATAALESSLAAERQARARERLTLARWMRLSAELRVALVSDGDHVSLLADFDAATVATVDALLAEGGGEGGT